MIWARKRLTVEKITTFMHIKDIREGGRRDNLFSSFMIGQLAMGLNCLNLQFPVQMKSFSYQSNITALNSKGWEAVKFPTSEKK